MKQYISLRKTLLCILALIFVFTFTPTNASTIRQQADRIRQQAQERREAERHAMLARHDANLQHSQSIRQSGFITGQAFYPQGQLVVGLRGSGRANGCGPFAVYNAVFYLRGGHLLPVNLPNPNNIAAIDRINQSRNNNRAKLAPCPADIILQLEQLGGLNFGGAGGSNPDSIAEILRQFGFDVTLIYAPQNLDGQIREACAAIVLYGAVTGGFFIHYVMVRYAERPGDAPGQFLMHGEMNRDTGYFAYSSIDRWLEVGRSNYRRGYDEPSGYSAIALLVIERKE